jgi:hypothetical protein
MEDFVGMKRTVYALATLVSVLGIVILIWQRPLFSCSDTVLTEVVSPDKKHVATVFERDAGATSDYSTLVTVRRILDCFNTEKNRIFVLAGRHVVTVSWDTGTNLYVRYDAQVGDIFKQDNTTIDSIKVTYQGTGKTSATATVSSVTPAPVIRWLDGIPVSVTWTRDLQMNTLAVTDPFGQTVNDPFISEGHYCFSSIRANLLESAKLEKEGRNRECYP